MLNRPSTIDKSFGNCYSVFVTASETGLPNACQRQQLCKETAVLSFHKNLSLIKLYIIFPFYPITPIIEVKVVKIKSL